MDGSNVFMVLKKECKGGDIMYVTYSDLIQIGMFIVALVGLCYTIMQGKRK